MYISLNFRGMAALLNMPYNVNGFMTELSRHNDVRDSGKPKLKSARGGFSSLGNKTSLALIPPHLIHLNSFVPASCRLTFYAHQ